MDTAGGTSHISTALIFMAALCKYAKYWHLSTQKFTHLSLMTLPQHPRQVGEPEIPMRQLQLSPSIILSAAECVLEGDSGAPVLQLMYWGLFWLIG